MHVDKAGVINDIALAIQVELFTTSLKLRHRLTNNTMAGGINTGVSVWSSSSIYSVKKCNDSAHSHTVKSVLVISKASSFSRFFLYPNYINCMNSSYAR